MKNDQPFTSGAIQGHDVNVYIRILPYSRPVDAKGTFLVTSIDIRLNENQTEYWVTLLGDQADKINGLKFCDMIQELHKQGIAKTCKKIVSFIERDMAEPKPIHLSDHRPFNRKCRKTIKERYNNH